MSFEDKGLGVYPFFFYARTIGVGKCEYCGTKLKNLYHIEDSSGKHFVVGSECVKYSEDKKLIEEVKELKKTTGEIPPYKPPPKPRPRPYNNFTDKIATEIRQVNSKFHVGKYKDQRLIDIVQSDRQYADWFYNNYRDKCPVIVNAYKKRLGVLLGYLE